MLYIFHLCTLLYFTNWFQCFFIHCQKRSYSLWSLKITEQTAGGTKTIEQQVHIQIIKNSFSYDFIINNFIILYFIILHKGALKDLISSRDTHLFFFYRPLNQTKNLFSAIQSFISIVMDSLVSQNQYF